MLVDGARTPISTLVSTKAVAFLLANPTKSGHVCRHGARCQHRTECSFVHFKDSAAAEAPAPAAAAHPADHRPAGPAASHVRVEGELVAVSTLWPTKAVEYLLANPTKSGKVCAHDPRCSRGNDCVYVHRRTMPKDIAAAPAPRFDGPARATPATVKVAGADVPVAELQPTQALDYLLVNPAKSGNYCTRGTECPFGERCTYVHRRVNARGVQHAPAAATVTVDGAIVPVASLRPTAGLTFIQANAGKAGKTCVFGAGCTKGSACTYIHKASE